ncbi:MAG: hypothetical protein AAB359_08630 [Elusimicrobiota bacterium]
MNRNEFNELKKRVTQFQNLANAINWSNRTKWPGYIIQGNDGTYWACRPVDFEKLIKSGYEATPIL